jgi:amino acid adenylation domain-containing protein
LFETLLVFENWKGDLTTSDWGPDLAVRDVRGHHIEAGHPLTVVIAPGPALSIDLTYDKHRFETLAIERLLANLQVLLDGMVADPTSCLADLPLLTAAERKLVLYDWNDTQESYPEDPCIHEMFERQVLRTPSATALVCGEEQLSYAELDLRANQLAHHLRGLGVRRETLVGVCVARSAELVTSLLAILKAGGAYVPLDPDYPPERLAYMLQDSGAKIVVTQDPFADRLRGSGDGPIVLSLDQARQQILAESESKPESQVGASNLAYVIYTSGSTGAPKGTAIEHRNLANLLHWARGIYDDDELSGVMLSTSICFDLSTFELFVPLSWGGRVFLAQNALELPILAGRSEVRLVNSVPSAITALAQIGGIPATVSSVNMAGEALRADLVDRLYAQGVRRVCDLYGPSETTTYSTYTQRTANGPETVGTPVGNTTIYLLDRNQQPVPAGVSGEIFIGGAGVARGYLGRPQLTAERFLPDPFRWSPGARMYRTGDLARHRPDGSLELMGRLDHQVKIRGFRIEVGEIEVTLGQHPAISEQVVLAREDAPGDKRLVAYLVSPAETRPGIEELRSHLRNSLPEYMLPSAFVWLEALPRTPNGKLDRRQLPAPERTRPELEQGYVAPRTPVEKKIAEIWLTVLDVDRVGVHDNFFDLGGHSLLLLPVTDELQRAFDLRMLAGELVHPTLGQLAALCEERMAKPEGPAPAGLMRRIYDVVRGSASPNDGGTQDRAPDRAPDRE